MCVAESSPLTLSVASCVLCRVVIRCVAVRSLPPVAPCRRADGRTPPLRSAPPPPTPRLSLSPSSSSPLARTSVSLRPAYIVVRLVPVALLLLPSSSSAPLFVRCSQSASSSLLIPPVPPLTNRHRIAGASPVHRQGRRSCCVGRSPSPTHKAFSLCFSLGYSVFLEFSSGSAVSVFFCVHLCPSVLVSIAAAPFVLVFCCSFALPLGRQVLVFILLALCLSLIRRRCRRRGGRFHFVAPLAALCCAAGARAPDQPRSRPRSRSLYTLLCAAHVTTSRNPISYPKSTGSLPVTAARSVSPQATRRHEFVC